MNEWFIHLHFQNQPYAFTYAMICIIKSRMLIDPFNATCNDLI